MCYIQHMNIHVNSPMNLPTQLWELRDHFRAQGFDIKLVGGCVRDHVSGTTPKDVDLHTDATPDECVKIYQAHDVRHELTGLQHGTITVVFDHVPYEITSLRTDVDTDGRHAQVAFTRDWTVDLERRDFTFNAMSMSFEGHIMDPFNGMEDLKNGLVRFVGDAHARIQEDYLRILRWFRFRGRFESNFTHDPQAHEAVCEHAPGLARISRERVWSEIQKILVGPLNVRMMEDMHRMKVTPHVNLPFFLLTRNSAEALKLDVNETHAVTMLVQLYGGNCVSTLKAWKASQAHIQLAEFLCGHVTDSPFRMMAVHGVSRQWAQQLGILQKMEPLQKTVLQTWDPPVFPVTGTDLIAQGIKPGPAFGEILRRLKTVWADENYTSTKQQLLQMVGSA